MMLGAVFLLGVFLIGVFDRVFLRISVYCLGVSADFPQETAPTRLGENIKLPKYLLKLHTVCGTKPPRIMNLT